MAVLYIVFKITLRSKIIPMSEIDFQSEFAKIHEEKQAEASTHEGLSDGTFRRAYVTLRKAVLSRGRE